MRMRRPRGRGDPVTSIVVVFPKIEDGRSIKNVLVRSGHPVAAVCRTGAQALSYADGLSDGIVICGYKMADMLFTQLLDMLPDGFELLLLASGRVLDEYAGSGCLSLAMPLKVHELTGTVDMMVQQIERRRRRRRMAPRERKPEETALIREAKELLMQRNNMTEEEAYRYLQKCSMDSSTNLVETAQMVLSMMDI